MPNDREAPDAYDMIIAFGLRNGKEGQVKWVEKADGKREYEPGPPLAEEPLTGAEIIDIGGCSFVVFRKQDIIAYCPVVLNRPYAC